MTIKEAFEALSVATYNCDTATECGIALDTLAAAIERQSIANESPVKVIRWMEGRMLLNINGEEFTPRAKCGGCGVRLSPDRTPKFCPNCGRALIAQL